MPRCPECYKIVSHRQLDTHIECCCSSTDRGSVSVDGLERLALRLHSFERQIDRRIDALEAELDGPGSHPNDGREPVETEDLTPPPT